MKSSNTLGRQLLAKIPPVVYLGSGVVSAAWGAVLAKWQDHGFMGGLLIALGGTLVGIGLYRVLGDFFSLSFLEKFGDRSQLEAVTSPKEMLKILTAFYRSNGFDIEELSGKLESGEDADLLVSSKETQLVVQFGNWKIDGSLDATEIQGVVRAMRRLGALGAVVVTKQPLAPEVAKQATRYQVKVLLLEDIASEIRGEDVRPQVFAQPEEEPPHGDGRIFLFLDAGVVTSHFQVLAGLLHAEDRAVVVFCSEKGTILTRAQAALPSYHPRILGVTPTLHTPAPEEEGEHLGHGRYREILAFLNWQPERDNARWIAIDSSGGEFPPGCSNVVVVGENGLDQSHAADVLRRLRTN